MKDTIQIIQKPDWVSWEDIRQCLIEAHSLNRARGINMTHYQWPADKIRDSLGANGKMLVALDGKIVVGTAAIAEKTGNIWYVQGRFAYICFGSVLPSYSGQGIFRRLDSEREKVASQLGYNVLLFDTHEKNYHRQKIAKKTGYTYVRFFQAQSKDHYSVVMAKWLNGCPYSKFYCWLKYQESKIKVLLRTVIKR